MITYIGIILGIVCLIAVAIIGYFLYNRISNQQIAIDNVISHQMELERILIRPPPRQELNSFMNKQVNYNCAECDVSPIPGMKDNIIVSSQHNLNVINEEEPLVSDEEPLVINEEPVDITELIT